MGIYCNFTGIQSVLLIIQQRNEDSKLCRVQRVAVQTVAGVGSETQSSPAEHLEATGPGLCLLRS